MIVNWGKQQTLHHSLGMSFSRALRTPASQSAAIPLTTCLLTSLRSASSTSTSRSQRSSKSSAALRHGSMDKKVYSPSMTTIRWRGEITTAFGVGSFSAWSKDGAAMIGVHSVRSSRSSRTKAQYETASKVQCIPRLGRIFVGCPNMIQNDYNLSCASFGSWKQSSCARVRCQPSRLTRTAFASLDDAFPSWRIAFTLSTTILAKDDFPDAGIPDKPTNKRLDGGVLGWLR
jgi:hypothetical protein